MNGWHYLDSQSNAGSCVYRNKDDHRTPGPSEELQQRYFEAGLTKCEKGNDWSSLVRAKAGVSPVIRKALIMG